MGWLEKPCIWGTIYFLAARSPNFTIFFSFSLVDEKQISLRFQIDFEFKMQKSNLGRQNEIRMITNEIVSHDVGLWDTIKHNRKYIG